MCNYVGECEGTIYPDEVKTCTVENYIFAERFTDPPPEPDDNTASAAQSSSSLSNNPTINHEQLSNSIL